MPPLAKLLWLVSPPCPPSTSCLKASSAMLKTSTTCRSPPFQTSSTPTKGCILHLLLFTRDSISTPPAFHPPMLPCRRSRLPLHQLLPSSLQSSPSPPRRKCSAASARSLFLHQTLLVMKELTTMNWSARGSVGLRPRTQTLWPSTSCPTSASGTLLLHNFPCQVAIVNA